LCFFFSFERVDIFVLLGTCVHLGPGRLVNSTGHEV